MHLKLGVIFAFLQLSHEDFEGFYCRRLTLYNSKCWLEYQHKGLNTHESLL
jgi:hypothetical protein